MNYRIAEIFKDTAMGAAGTEKIPIDVSEPISQLMIKQRSTGAGDIPTAHLVACLPKVEIVDGSDRIFSLGGYEMDAFDFYHRKVVPANVNTYVNNQQGIRTYYINFGRYLYDRELALDPSKFKNPQLQITYDRDAGGCASDALELQVVAHLFDEKKVSPVGFLMHKEIKKYTLSQGSWENTPMPTDYPWRMLLMSSRYAGKGPHNQFREVKLTEDVDKRIPFHFNTMNLIDWLQSIFPLYLEDHYCSITTSDRTNYVTPSWEVKYSGNMESAVAGYLNVYYGMGGTMELRSSAPGNALGMVLGSCPHGSVCMPFGIQDDLTDWYDVSRIGSLKLLMKGHASANEGDCQICLQQLRRY